jgi:hypothetical protein
MALEVLKITMNGKSRDRLSKLEKLVSAAQKKREEGKDKL